MKRMPFVVLVLLVAVAAYGQTPPAEQPSPAPTQQPAQAETPGHVDQAPNPCANTEMKPGKDAKMERFYPAPMAQVKEAIVSAMKGLEFEMGKQTDTGFEANRKRHFGVMVGSGGEVLVVQMKEAEEGGVKGTKVTMETRKTFAGRVGQKTWTSAVLDQTDCMLKATMK